MLNYARVTELIGGADRARDRRAASATKNPGSGARLVPRVVVNATGALLRRRAANGRTDRRARMVAASQGAHLVFDRSFLPGETAFVVPKTPDGRVMFAIPWHGHTLVGTTDVAVTDASLEPVPMEREIEFILDTAGRYFQKPPTRADVLSTFAGIRPLVRGAGTNTAALSRDHTIHIDHSGLLTITGGKWTTYRRRGGRLREPRAARRVHSPKRPCGTRAAPHHHGAHTEGGTSVWHARGVRLRRGGNRGAGWRRTGTGSPASPGAHRTPVRRSSGRFGPRWRGRSRTCWRAALARCSSTRAPRSRWPRERPNCSHANSVATPPWQAARAERVPCTRGRVFARVKVKELLLSRRVHHKGTYGGHKGPQSKTEKRRQC